MRTKSIKNLLIFIAVTGILYSLYYTVVYTDAFLIKNIEISNDLKLTEQELIKYLDLQDGINYFSCNPYEVQSKIINHPLIKSGKVNKKMFNKLEIEIMERVPEVAVLYSNTYLLVDDDMVVVEVSDSPKDFYIINGYNFDNFYIGYKIRDDYSYVLRNAIDLVKLIEMSDLVIMPMILIIDNEIELIINDHFKAEFGDGTNMESKFENLYEIYFDLREKKYSEGIICLKYNGQATFRPFEE